MTRTPTSGAPTGSASDVEDLEQTNDFDPASDIDADFDEDFDFDTGLDFADSNDADTDHSATFAEDFEGERIAKALARAGIGSRREIERLIEAGRVTLYGEVLITPAVKVSSLDGIQVDGENVSAGEATRMWRLYKRRGTLTTHRDPEGRPTVFERLPKRLGRVISVGRLDMSTEGLLLLTNDGALARWMELPENALLRRYRVRVHGRVDERDLAELKDGATIDGIHYGEIDAALERQQGANAWLTIAIREGKNREVRRVMEHLGLTVNRLIRTHYGPFSLSGLALDQVDDISVKQMITSLGGFFGQEHTSVAAPKQKTQTSKWAKAAPNNKVRPGYKKSSQRRSPTDRDGDEKTTARQPASKTQPNKPQQSRPQDSARGGNNTHGSYNSRGNYNTRGGNSTQGRSNNKGKQR